VKNLPTFFAGFEMHLSFERGGQGASKKQRYFLGGQFLAAFLSNQTFQGFGLHSHSLGAREKIVPLKKLKVLNIIIIKPSFCSVDTCYFVVISILIFLK
jgi:hypothetical protein